MTSTLVNVIVAFWIILFGAMAIVPFMLDGKPQTRSNESTATTSATPSVRAEDRVISIRPVGLVLPQEQGVEAPGQVPASILAAANARAASLADHNGSTTNHQRQAA
ncbi:MAG: hypothetical protein ACTHQE_00555 [Thermomicrobiales bacterium]